MNETITIKFNGKEYNKIELRQLINIVIDGMRRIEEKVLGKLNFEKELTEEKDITPNQKEQLTRFGYYSYKEILDNLKKLESEILEKEKIAMHKFENQENIDKLQAKVYKVSGPSFPLDNFFDGIRDNKDPNFCKRSAYEDLERIVDTYNKIMNKLEELDNKVYELENK